MKLNFPFGMGSFTFFVTRESTNPPTSKSKANGVVVPKTVADLERDIEALRRELAEAQTINSVHAHVNSKLVAEIEEIREKARVYVVTELKKINQIESWLEDRCGAAPELIRVRTRESLMNYCDFLPLMKMIGGPWGELAARIEKEEDYRKNLHKDFTNPVEVGNYSKE
jgi:hypothetical protein